MSAWLRLSLKLHRFELILLGIALLALAAAMGAVAWQLNNISTASPECFGPGGGPQCPDVLDRFVLPDQLAETLLRLALAAPLAGVVLGAPIIAREIEGGTAQFTWAFAKSRTRWALARSLGPAAALFVLLAIVGMTGQWLVEARATGQDIGFNQADVRGLGMPLRGLLAFAAGVLCGALLGRVLPALLLAMPAYAVALLLVAVAMGPWRSSASIVQPMGRGEIRPGAYVIDTVAILPDGSVIPEDRADGMPEGSFQDGLRLLPASEATTWILREWAAIALATTLLGGLALIATRGRRPL